MTNAKFALRTMVLALAGSVLVFLGIGLILADGWEVSSTRPMDTPAAPVVERIVDLRRWSEWSALEFRLGSKTERTVEGVPGQPGQVATWRGPMGVAQLELTDITDDAVDYRLAYRYGDDDASAGGRFTGAIRWRELPPEGDGGPVTEVTWIERGSLDSLVARWSNWFGALQEKVRQVQGASLGGLEEAVRRAAVANEAAAKRDDEGR